MFRRVTSLTVCVLMTALLAACTPTRTTKSAGEQLDDTTITARVKAALARELGTGSSIRTDVETFRGRVQLSGFVDSEDKKVKAARVAEAVKGVEHVDNNLVVSTTPRTTGEYVDDKILTGKIKTKFASDPVVAAHQVNVDVRQGTVLLSGFVDSAEQKSRAGELAQSEPGVKQVDNQLVVKPR
jgi:hyperosmotically inducible periplasmic protein